MQSKYSTQMTQDISAEKVRENVDLKRVINNTMAGSGNPYIAMKINKKSRNLSQSPNASIRVNKRKFLQTADPRKRAGGIQCLPTKKYLEQLKADQQLTHQPN